MFQVDARGLLCPRPIIMAKKALAENTHVCVLVDNETSVENLQKMAAVMGIESKVNVNEGFWAVEMVQNEIKGQEKLHDKDTVIVIKSQFAGVGDDDLGSALMKSFIYTLTESEKLPATMIFYNGGVHLTTEGSPVIEDLRKLEAAGVEILSCGTCLNFYGLENKLLVGGVTNMYVIVEKQQNAGKIIFP